MPQLTSITMEELKVLCELFFNAGKQEPDFEKFFDLVMSGKYKKWVDRKRFEEIYNQMKSEIQEHMDKWDEQDRVRQAKAINDLVNFIITT